MQFSTLSSIGSILTQRAALLPLKTDFYEDTHTMCENKEDSVRKNNNVFQSNFLRPLHDFYS